MIVKLRIAHRNKKNGDECLWHLIDDANMRHTYALSVAIVETQEVMGLQIIILPLNLLIAWKKS
jgi:hypothetical protein